MKTLMVEGGEYSPNQEKLEKIALGLSPKKPLLKGKGFAKNNTRQSKVAEGESSKYQETGRSENVNSKMII